MLDWSLLRFPTYGSGKVGKGDYSIRPSSPARDAGTNADWMNGAVDLGGGPRIIGGRVDIGCYENNGHGFTILVR